MDGARTGTTTPGQSQTKNKVNYGGTPNSLDPQNQSLAIRWFSVQTTYTTFYLNGAFTILYGYSQRNLSPPAKEANQLNSF